MRTLKIALPVLTLTTMLTSAVAAASGEWSQWRGPDREDRSTETGLLKEWPADGPPLVWKAEGAGVGYSSVSVAGGRIFTMGDSPDASCVRAFSVADGKPIWTTPIGRPGGNYSGTRCTPTVDGELVYALAQYGELICVEAATGKERWRKHLVKDFGGKMAGWNFTESPLIEGDKVLCTPGGPQGTIVALKKRTGETVWQSKDFTDTCAYSSLVPTDLGGRRQVVQLTFASVAGVAVDNGELLWRAPRKGETAVIPTPIIYDNHVYVTSGYGVGCNLFKISRSGRGFSAEQVYANRDMINHHGGVIRVGDHLYGHSDSKGWVCMEFKTGKVVWADKGVSKGSVTYADGHLYCRNESGKGRVALVEATPAGYKEKGRFEQPDRSDKNSWAHPVIAGGKLYLRDQDVLLCYNVAAK